MANKAVFVDRDRTLIEDPGYISDPQVVKLLPGVELAIKSLHQAGYKVVVVTNQSGIARGLLSEGCHLLLPLPPRGDRREIRQGFRPSQTQTRDAPQGRQGRGN
jgi:hypothetical protein